MICGGTKHFKECLKIGGMKHLKNSCLSIGGMKHFQYDNVDILNLKYSVSGNSNFDAFKKV